MSVLMLSTYLGNPNSFIKCGSKNIDEMVNPIFILGSDRNGTTWLPNILCNHPEICGAQHRAHWGIKESYICRHILYWNDFDENDEFIKFLELYSSGDYFKLVEGDKEYFYENRPEDFTDFFFQMMDNYAEKKDAKYWTTKLDKQFYNHPTILKRFFQKADERYEKIKFIGIKRKYADVLGSALNMPGADKRWRKQRFKKEIFAIDNMINYAHDYNSIKKIISERNGLMLQFNLLKNDREKAFEKIIKYLNIDYSEKMLEDNYPANSSYRGREGRIKLPDWEEKMITIYLLPIFESTESLSRALQRLKNSLIGFPDCPLYFRLLKLEKFPERFKKELEEKGRVGLRKMLFEDDRR